MKKKRWKIIIAAVLSIYILEGCSSKETEGGENKLSPAGRITAVPDITQAAETAADTGAEDDTDPNYDRNFSVTLEAEDAEFTGGTRIEASKQGYGGTGYLNALTTDEDTVSFIVEVPGTGAYDLNFISAGNTGHKENNVLVDGVNAGAAIVDGDNFSASIVERVYLTAGEHQVVLTKSWGWIYLDALTVTASPEADPAVYEVGAALADPEATDRAKRLMQYLADMYGEYIISGQYGDRGTNGAEFTAIHDATGEYPAILGLDMIEYTPSRAAHGSTSFDVNYAREFDDQGGIVTFAWHWNAPEKYLINTDEVPWWKGFYTEGTNIDLARIMNGEDPEGYDLLLKDIDVIAFQLKRLQTMEIPILWRPLHEASGGWFWWGASGPEPYKELYQLLFDRLTNYHGIHNLIWVWNGQNKDWYPGGEYVDIVGTDIYPGEKVYTSQVSKFNELLKWTGNTRKIAAMTENGCMFDPDLAVRDHAMWSYFGTWEGEFLVRNNTYTLSEQYTETEMLKKVYTSEHVITLDELPDLSAYGGE